MRIRSAYEPGAEDWEMEAEEGSHIEGLQALRVHPLCVVDPVAVVVVVVVVVAVAVGRGGAETTVGSTLWTGVDMAMGCFFSWGRGMRL